MGDNSGKLSPPGAKTNEEVVGAVATATPPSLPEKMVGEREEEGEEEV